MAGFSDLFKKATGALNHLRGGGVSFLGKDGDIVYSKNNVCVHPPKKTDTVDGLLHSPGYLTIHCQHDDQLGVTLILQWLPNSTLEKNPGSIRCISPRNSANDARARIKLRHLQGDKKPRRESSSDSSGSCHDTVGETTTPTSETDVEIPQDQEETDPTPTEEDAVEISVEMTGDQLTVTSSAGKTRPSTFNTTLLPAANNGGGLGVPSINVIPHTPMAPGGSGSGGDSDHSAATSGADEASDREDGGDSSPYNTSDDEGGRIAETPIGSLTGETLSSLLDRYKELADIFESSPEQFAQAHNLMLPDGIRPSDGPNDSSVDIATGRVQFHQKSPAASLFSVNLGKMRSMRLFYSNPECTCGQLVIASPEAQYKILHFHHGGLDKLAQIFEQWNAVRAKSVKEGSPSPMPDRHFGVCHPEISKGELDPEDGLYDRVDWDFWRASTNKDGGIDDNFTIRKAIFFASMDVSLRREAWPFMLRVYPWNSTREQRDTIRNDLFLEYQSIRKRRMKDCLRAGGPTWQSVENTVTKDVVRTDRKNPFYEGDDNPNMDIMKNILMNYAVMCPAIGYIQGMSDLLAPILCTIQNEADAFWCFAGLMQRTIFVSSPRTTNNMMDKNLEYLRELLKLLLPDFFRHVAKCGSDALQLMFVHRWILLCFKREFPESSALHVWEACWADYRTAYFHLFVCVAIVAIYGQDVVVQQLPHDEILLYFSSLAMHMDADVVLKKARGLLYQFCRLEKIPCTLAGLCQFQTGSEQWDSHIQPMIECSQVHGDNDPCPFAGK